MQLAVLGDKVPDDVRELGAPVVRDALPVLRVGIVQQALHGENPLCILDVEEGLKRVQMSLARHNS